jgi:hypothetical protein
MASKIKALRLETCQPLARHLFGGFVWRSGHSYKAYGASFCAPAGFTLTSAIFLLAGCVFYFAFATSSADAATYYLDAVNGNDINAGTSQAPWKTISRAEPNWNGAGTKVTSGDTVKLRNGNYGMFRLTYYTGTDWINYQADTGHSPVLSNIIIDNTGTLRTAYLRFDGIDVIQSDPGYNPNDPPWDYGNRLYLRKVKYFEIKNALISGFNKYLNEIGIYVASSCQITIERCEITKGKFGIFVPGDSNNVSILWNYIHESLASSVSLYGGYHTIVGNHISDSYDDPDDDFFPPDVLSLDTMVFPEGNNPGFQVGEEIWSPATGEPLRKGTVLTYKWIDGQWKVYLKNVWPSSEVFNDGHTCRSQITEVNFVAVNVTGGLHRGSGLSIRSRNSIIRKNILHNLSGQGLYFYQGIGGHYGDVVENNCIYDTVNLNNFFQFSGALVCRNNTFIGYQANTTMNAKNICDKYNGAISTSYSGLPWYGSFDGTGVVYYNNIFMAAGPFPDPNDPNVNGYEEDYNIVWRRYYAGNYEPTSAKGANSKVLVWKDPNTTSNYGLRGYPNSFEDIGYRGSTPEYSYSKDGITPFFVNPSFKFFRSNESLNAGVGSIWDYRLAAGSLGVNFGAYRVATYAEVLSGAVTGPSQPPDSLGSLGPDGFIRDDGPRRDSTHHSVGCYEYGPADVNNQPPVLNEIGNKSVNENSLLTVGVTASDADGDAITYSVSGLPSGATFAGQTFNWTPTYSQAGNYTVTFVVSDGKAQDSETITITANNVNRAPVLSSIGNKSVHVDDLLTFSVSATDPDGDAVTYSVEGLPSGAVFANQSFSWTPSYQQADTYQVTFIASDGQAQDSKTVTITVNNVNQPPVLAAIGSKSVSENSALSFSVSATDADGDTITYSAQNLPTGANFSGQTFSWTPGYEQAGTYQVTFIASDGSGQDSETITITANNVNRAPVLGAIGNKSVNENSLLTVGITASDADGDTITYSVNGLPSGATFAGQTFNWTPTYSQAGNYTVTFVVSDGQMQDSETITITANNVNRAPVLGAIGNKSVYMGNNLTFAVSATDPDGDVIEFSADGLPGSATFVSQTFAWSPVNSQVGNHQVTFAASDGPLEDSETITIAVLSTDTSPPVVTNCLPAADAVQLPLNGLITLHIADAGKGVDANSVVIKVSNNVVYSGDTAVYSSAYGDCYRSGTKADYMFVYQTNEMFDFEQTIAVAVSAADLAGNVMSQHPYSFTTEMRSFGQNRKVNSGSDTLMKAAPATVRDISGNIWAVWHKGSAGSRDIYIGKLAAGADNFGSSIQLTKSGADQCNPAVAIGSDDKIYVVWQDNRRGNWDIYISTSVDGVSWSAERIVTDSNNNQVNPAIAIDKLSTNRAHIVWQDDRNGNQDIYIATSSNSFLTATISPITSNSSGQIEPVIAVDSSNTVYVVWSDARGGSRDIYGAASNYGPWTNVPIVNNANNQSSPAIAVESEGTILHILWVDDRSGNQDIYYATSDGLPSSPLSGSNIIDDTSGAAQSSPAIVASGSTRDGLKVFACWQDRRNVSSNGGDTDIYLAELTYGTGTNVLVGDDGTNADQSEPAMGIDKYGHPYLVWTDGRNAKMEIYYAGSTFVEAVALETQNVSGTSRTVVGTEPANISSADDVSVVVPAGAYPCDVKIVISKIRNPHAFTMQCLGGYDFGPSGIPFSQPVTVTIPYTPSSSGNSASAYWYNSLTGAISQQGISNVQNIVISPTLHALQFETAHFTPFYLLFAGGKTTTGGGGGGRSGGGCSMSAGSEGDIVEFLLPYVGLAVVMLVLKLGDRRNQKVRGIA